MTKTIPQLTAATLPVDLASLMEISIPGGGSRKLTLSNLGPTIDLTTTALTISNAYVVLGDFNPGFLGITDLIMDIIDLIGSFGNELIPAATLLASLVNLTAPNWANVTGHFQPAFDSLVHLDLPVLGFVGGIFGPQNTNVNLTRIRTPLLARVGRDVTFSAANLIEFGTANLVYVGRHFDPTFNNLPALDMSSAQYIGGDFDIYSEQITSLIFTSVFKHLGGVFRLNGVGKLPQANIDAILVRLAALDGTGGTTSYDNNLVNLAGGTNASPGVAGLAAKATLIGRGNTVTTN